MDWPWLSVARWSLSKTPIRMFHGNVHVATVCQFKTLHEVATLVRQRLLGPQAVMDFTAWACREEHFDHQQHRSKLSHWEQEWMLRNCGSQHNTLCQPPSYIRDDSTKPLWSQDGALTHAGATADASLFLARYFSDAQETLSRVHHHWHP